MLKPQMDGRMPTLHGKIEECTNGLLRGWIWEPAAPDRTISPAITIDDIEVMKVDADIPRRDLALAGIGDGRHGFEYLIPAHLRDGQVHRVSLSLESADELPTSHARMFEFPEIPHTIVGRLEGFRGGALVGWVWDRASASSRIEIEVSARGQVIGITTADLLRPDLVRSGIGDGRHGYKFILSPSLLDGDESLDVTVRTTKEFGGQTLGIIAASSDAQSRSTPLTSVKTLVASAHEDGRQNTVGPPPIDEISSSAPRRVNNEHFSRLVRESDVKGLVRLASEMEASKDLLGARDALEYAHELEPNNFEVLFRIARVALAQGHADIAERHAKRAIDIKKKHPKPSIVLARIAESKGERLLALEYWQNVPRNDSAFVERLQKSARMLIALERPLEALPLLAEACRIKPGDMRLRAAEAQLLEDLGFYQMAISCWNSIAALDPSDRKPNQRVERLQTIKHEPTFRILPRRYRRAMTAIDQGVAIATGGSAEAIVSAFGLAWQLHKHFNCSVTMVTSQRTPETDHIERHLPVPLAISQISYDTHYELLFVLPDFHAANPSAELPSSNTAFSYAMDGHAPIATFSHRNEAYRVWLEEKLGCGFEDEIIPVLNARSHAIHEVLLIFREGAGASDRLAAIIGTLDTAEIGIKPVVWGTSPGSMELLTATGDRDLAVTDDVVVAHFLSMSGKRVLFIGGDNALGVTRVSSLEVLNRQAGPEEAAKKIKQMRSQSIE